MTSTINSYLLSTWKHRAVRYFLAILVSCVACGLHAADLDSSNYTTYEGTTGDGVRWLYVVPKEKILLLHGEIITPIEYLPDVPGYQMRINSDGSISDLYENDAINVRNIVDVCTYFGLSCAPSTYQVFSGDFNGDGEGGLLLQGSGDSPSFALVDHGSDTSAAPALFHNFGTELDQSTTVVSMEDYDGDGLVDVVGSEGNGYQYVFINSGSAFGVKEFSHSLLIGTTKGSVSVSPTGAANYTIPIAVPPGVAGTTPNLALSFSSQSGNGPLGIGWSLSGLSTITRCPTTLVHDGVIDGVDFDNNDRFCLDGQRLIPIGNNEYRTEFDTFSKITAYGSAGSGPSYFHVLSKDGSVYEFGVTSDAKVEPVPANGSIAMWAVNRIEDRFGNAITVSYTKNSTTGEFYPSSIDYLGGGNQIRFDYEPRPDTVNRFTLGYLASSAQRLQRVVVLVDTEVVRRYEFRYQQSAVTGESLVESIQECAAVKCLAPTSFNWEESINSTQYSTQSGGEWGGSAWTYTGDYDGDGITDIASAKGDVVYLKFGHKDVGKTGNSVVKQAWSVDGVWSDPVGYTGVGDFNGDGLTDIASAVGSNIHIKLSTGNGFVSTYWPISGASAGSWGGADYTWFGDFNGDGLTDIASASYGNVYMKLSNGVDGFTSQVKPVANAWGGPGFTFIGDFNGDSLPDIASESYGDVYMKLSNGAGFSSATWHIPSSEDSSFLKMGDFNGDGLSDLVSRKGGQLRVHYSTGAAFTTKQFAEGAGFGDAASTWIADFDGDGMSDIASALGTSLYMRFFRDNGFAQRVWNITGSTNGYTQLGDFNGDGAFDFISAAGTTLHANVSRVRSPSLKSVTNGFGVQTEFTYLPLSDSSLYTKGSSANYPVQDVIAPMYVVSMMTSDNGAGGSRSVEYEYAGLRTHLTGYGLLGFAKVTSTNSQTGITSSTEYYQHYPYTGLPFSSETRLSNGDLLSRNLVTAVANKAINNNGAITQFPYVSETVTQNYVLNSTTGRTEWVSSVTTSNTYDNYGNPLSIDIETSDGTSSWVKQTRNHYDNDIVNWLLGRLTRSDVTSIAPNVPPVVRASAFNYHPTTGALTQEIIEPDDHALSLTTTYTHDIFGNRHSITRCGGDPAACMQGAVGSRTSTTTYDSNGQFPVSSSNALGHTETRAFDAYLGVLTSHSDANGITTTWNYDSLGRKTLETRADGTQTRIEREWCGWDCPANAYYKVTTRTDGSSDSIIFLDRFNREVRQQGVGFGGVAVYIDTEYDSFGRVKRNTNAYSLGDEINWTTPTYDVLGRVESIEAPDDSVSSNAYQKLSVTSTNSLGQSKTETKNLAGQLINVTDELGATVTYNYSADGKLLSTTHSDSLYSKAVSTFIGYDDLGRKDKMIDPDKGTWFYTYSALGELAKQYKVVSTHRYNSSLADALEDPAVEMQRTEMAYDVLGRLRVRTDYNKYNQVEDSSSWHYDTADNGIGKLHTVASNGKISEFDYDVYGRLIAQSDVVDSTVAIYSTSYDDYGRISQTTDAVSSGSGTVNHYHPTYGYLERVTDLATDELLFQIEAMNARGQVTQLAMGNGHTTQRFYDDKTGKLLQVIAGNGITELQNITYSWDTVGNMLARDDQSAPFGVAYDQQQSYCYDDLNRLVKTYHGSLSANCSINEAGQDIRYNDLGDITYKATVGNYSYGSSTQQPHAVQSTDLSGVVTAYSYDNTGNLVGDSLGRTFQYTTFDKPSLMIRGDAQVAFSYGADRSRFRRIDTNAVTGQTTTTYYLGSVEKIVKANGSYEMRRAIGGYALWTHEFDAAGNETGVKKQYIYKDVLGSTNTVTDDVGAVVDAMAFDPWGAKVNAANWSALTQGSYLGVPLIDQQRATTRGFTGHEQVDSIGVIHMNGRIYDANLGRFIQADPMVDGVTDTQGFNRYAYVRNNPLNKTDPTGFYSWDDFEDDVKKAARNFEDQVRAEGRRFEDSVRGWGPQIRSSLRRFEDSLRKGFYVSGSTDGENHTGCAGDYSGNELCYTYTPEPYTPDQGQQNNQEYVQRQTEAGTTSEDTGGKSVNGAATASWEYSQSFLDTFAGQVWLASDDWLPGGAQKGIPISKYEQQQLDLGTKAGVINFYESRVARGDGYGALALDVVLGRGRLGNMANAQLALEVMVRMGPGNLPNYEAFMESVNVGLARAHADYVASDFNTDTTGVPGLLHRYQIQQYHENYFESRGLSPATFGGATTIPFVGTFNNDSIFRWCSGCDTNY